jgi:hypothetical protein
MTMATGKAKNKNTVQWGQKKYKSSISHETLWLLEICRTLKKSFGLFPAGWMSGWKKCILSVKVQRGISKASVVIPDGSPNAFFSLEKGWDFLFCFTTEEIKTQTNKMT